MPSKGLLLCGRLRFPIKVYPVLPDVDHSNYYQFVLNIKNISWYFIDNKIFSITVHEMTRTLSIVAFKPKEKVLGEPSIFRLWMFIDKEYEDKKEKVNKGCVFLPLFYRFYI